MLEAFVRLAGFPCTGKGKGKKTLLLIMIMLCDLFFNIRIDKFYYGSNV